jgi:hypothetical protein
VFVQGLHEYLTQFIEQILALSGAIARDFMLIE